MLGRSPEHRRRARRSFWAVRKLFEAQARGASARRRSSTTSTGPSRPSSTSSSTSRTGLATRRSCSSAWPAPSCSTSGRAGAAASSTRPRCCSSRLTDGESDRARREPPRPRAARRAGPGADLDAAEGNPLFVEEMLAMLIDDGLLARERRRLGADRRSVADHRAADDPGAAGGAARPAGARRARGDRASAPSRARSSTGAPSPSSRQNELRRVGLGAPADARPQGADPARPAPISRARTRSASGTC